MKFFKLKTLVASLSVVGLVNAYATVESDSAASIALELDNLQRSTEKAQTANCSGTDSLQIRGATSSSDHDADFEPSNAIDGDLSIESRWSSQGVGNSLVLDLGVTSFIDEMYTAWYKGDVREALFEVRTSPDRSDWTTVLSGQPVTGSQGLIKSELTDTRARYVEIVGLGNSDSAWNSIIEVDILGCNNGETVEPETPEPVTPEPVTPQPPPPPPRPPRSGDVNAVFNGTFENGLSGWAQVEPASGSADAFEGVGAGKVDSSARLSQTIFVETQGRYRVTAQLQGDPTIGVRVGGRNFTAEGPDDGGSYAEVSFEFDSGSANEAELFVQASSSGDSQRADNIEAILISGGDGSNPIDPNTVFDFSIWEVEGENPVTRDGTMRFDALEQCVVTPNGNGCRHEIKVQESERFGLTEQFEFFSANIQANLDAGSETIVVQHHPEETGTLAALYLSDKTNTQDGIQNGRPRDGIFDVYATVRKPNGTRENEDVVLGTVRSGEAFDYEVINDHGIMTISAFGERVVLQSADSSASYLKFGNYIQARDPVTGERMELDKPLGPEDRAAFLRYYSSKGIDNAVVTFRNIQYSRTLD